MVIETHVRKKKKLNPLFEEHIRKCKKNLSQHTILRRRYKANMFFTMSLIT